MALNKFALWGTLPPTKPTQPGLAKIIDNGLTKIVGAPGPAPSPDAFRVLAVLGQVRDALLDQNKATQKSVNTLLANAKGSQSATDAHAELQRRDRVLAQDFLDQFRDLDGKDFDLQRRDRVAELMAFETKIAQRVK